MADSSYVYDASPTTATTGVSLQELSNLAATGGRAFGKDPRKISHFVQRCGITVQSAQEQMRGMRRMIEELQVDRERAGTPTTLSPSASAKFLPDEELARLAGGRAADALESAAKVRREAEATRRAARAELNQIRYILSTMLESPGVSPDTRVAFKQMQSELELRWPTDPADPANLPEELTVQAGPTAAGVPSQPSTGAAVPAPPEPIVDDTLPASFEQAMSTPPPVTVPLLPPPESAPLPPPTGTPLPPPESAPLPPPTGAPLPPPTGAPLPPPGAPLPAADSTSAPGSANDGTPSDDSPGGLDSVFS